MSTTNSDIPIQDTASDREDPEYYEKCLSDYEQEYENYCDVLLNKFLSDFPPINIYALPEDEYGPTPKRKGGQGNG